MEYSIEELHKEFPFLICTPDNEWCYGNSDEISWWNNIDKGWQELSYNMFKEIKDVLIEHNLLNNFRINQLKEKFGTIRLYYDFINLSSEKYKFLVELVYNKIDKIIDKYENLSYITCINCGNKAKYITQGYILPYCENCIKPEWKVKELKLC